MAPQDNYVTPSRRFRKLAPIALLVVVAAIVLVQTDRGPSDTSNSVWVTAIDGDTLRYEGKKLRLLGVDTPEPSVYGNAECAAEAALGNKATAFTKNIVAENKVVIEWSGDKDRYGRDLVNVRVNGTRLGDMLIAEGLAEPWRGSQADWCRILG